MLSHETRYLNSMGNEKNNQSNSIVYETIANVSRNI